MRAGQHRWGSIALASLVIAALQGGSPLCAQPPAEADAVPARPVLVMVLPVDPADAATADALTELLIGTVASSGATAIVGKEELQAQLGQTDEATLECIGSPTCLGRVGVQLGVADILAATVARRGERWVFDLHRLDPRSGESTAHAFREVEGELGALADAMIDALGALDEPAVPTAVLRIGVDVVGAEVWVDGESLGTFTGTPLEASALEPGPHEVRAEASGHERWARSVELEAGDVVRLEAALRPIRVDAGVPPPPVRPAPERRLSPLLWVGMGTAIAGAGAALGFGISSRREPEAGVNRAEALAFTEDRRRDARIANAAMGISIAGLGLMVIGLWRSELGGEASGSALRLSPRPGGAALDWSGRW